MALDPNYIFDTSDVIFYGTDTYAQALNALKVISGQSETAVELGLRANYGAADYWAAMEALKDAGVVVGKNANGYRCFGYASDVSTTLPNNILSSLDSNATSTTIIKAAPAYDVVVDTVETSPSFGKVIQESVGKALSPEHGFHGWKFFAGECLQAVGAVSAGITLGKTFDSILYNANPDFWDAHGMASLNPETWAAITNGDDSFAAGLFNMIFGIDPESGKGQAFIDEQAFAYLSYYMKTMGVFGSNLSPVYDSLDVGSIVKSADFMTGTVYDLCNQIGLIIDWDEYYPNIDKLKQGIIVTQSNEYMVAFNRNAGTITFNSDEFEIISKSYHSQADIYTYDVSNNIINETITRAYHSGSPKYPSSINRTFQNMVIKPSAYNVMAPIPIKYVPPIEGIGNQEGATLPNTDTWVDVPSTLTSLKEQYPDLWQNAVPNTLVQPDGTTQTITYIPVAMPNAKNQWDTQPVSGDSTQTNSQVQPIAKPTNENNQLLKTLLQLITMPDEQPKTDTKTETKPQPDIPNPPTTGTGDTPISPVPSGNASALWSVYHPTQAQVNNFGAWLWSDDIITKIQQVLENPMEGIITLHKVFATPIDSGNGSIVVGRLDSNVPSATVNQQYVSVDCGYVDCNEYFGSVFDYAPYTSISLYLPFIGIVPLNVSDVMRGKVHVTYGVDVFTGACLAMIEIIRDNCTANIYQYSGVASVEYPLTGGVHSGLINGLLGIAGGVAGIAMASTGVGAVAGASTIAGGLASAAKTNNARASSFSGNAGAMGVKIPYLIIERPQIKIAETFPNLAGYPTNYSCRIGDCEGQINVRNVHVSGINATEKELTLIENLLKSGIII